MKRLMIGHKELLIVSAFIVLVVAYSLPNLTTRPRPWIDEALSIEISRNVMDFDAPDIQLRPGILSGIPERLQSTGYSVTYPLSLIFMTFGYGIFQARMFMLILVVAALVMAYILVKSLSDRTTAFMSMALIGTFASFYANGLTVTGEIPGFLFLMAGFIFIFKEKPWLGGLMLGLAVVSKPSVFIPMIPAFAVAYLLKADTRWIARVKNLAKVGLGALPAVALWMIVVLPEPSDIASWSKLASFYKNPYGQEVGGYFLQNLMASLGSSTIIYFALIFILIIIARIVERDRRFIFLYDFSIIYSLLAFLYYLRGPGWLRYILVAELILLMLLPHSIRLITARWEKIRESWKYAVIALACFQFVQYRYFSNVYSSDRSEIVAEAINGRFPNASVAVYQLLDVSVLLNTDERYNAVAMTGVPELDRSPLDDGFLTDIVVVPSDGRHISEIRPVLSKHYELEMRYEDAEVYRRVR